MRTRRGLASLGAATSLVLSACGNGDTPADDISPKDTLQSSTVSTETDNTEGPTESPSE